VSLLVGGDPSRLPQYTRWGGGAGGRLTGGVLLSTGMSCTPSCLSHHPVRHTVVMSVTLSSCLSHFQVLDDTAGPITRKEYELMQAPAGDSLYGAVVNYIGQPNPDIDTPENRRHLQAHKASVLAAAAATSAAASGSSSSSSGSTERPLMTTSWDEEGGGPDVAGSGMNAPPRRIVRIASSTYDKSHSNPCC